MLARISLCIGIVLGMLLGGCSRPGEQPAAADKGAAPAVPAPPAPASKAGASGEVVARWADGTLTADQLMIEFERLPSRSRRAMSKESRKQFVENQILQELLFEEGTRRGLPDDPEIKQQVEGLYKRLVVQRLVQQLQKAKPVTDEQIEKYYEANRDRYSTSTIRARHILVADEAKAKDLKAELDANPGRFEELARDNSTDVSSARKGGDLGFFGHGRNPEFEEVAFALKENGQISDVVKTRYGYHIIQLVDRREGKQKTLDEVREQIRTTLQQQAIQDQTQGYFDRLKQDANVQIDEAAVDRVAASVPEPSPGVSASIHGH